MKKTVFSALAFTAFAATATTTPLSPSGDATSVTAAIQDAIDAAGPGEVVTLAPGTYPINQTLILSNGASLIGGGSDRGDVVLSLATTEADSDLQSVIRISASADTVVSNLTVTGKNAWRNNNVKGPDAAIKMDSGILVDCTIEDCKTKNGMMKGGGIKLSGDGTVRNCTITRCEAFNSSGYYGAGEAIYMTGGLVDNCIIVSNAVSHACNAQDMAGGTVYISGGTLRGCLIADNVAHRNGSGVSAVGGVVESCTIAGNRNFSGDSDACGVWVKGNGIVLHNNIIWGNTAYDGKDANFKFANDSSMTSASLEYNDTKPAFTVGMGNTSVDPMFEDADSCNYRCRYSYCVDAGGNQEWMENAIDLDGNARVINSRVDMGCYEREATSGFVCRMSVVSDEAPDLSTVELSCEYSGCPSGAAESAAWVFTRKEDGTTVEATGFVTSVALAAGTWDAALTVRGGGQFASCEYEDAVFVRASRVYANVNGRGEFPYDTVEKGLPSIIEAMGCLGNGGTLYVAPGSYVISSSISLVDDGCTRIESLAGPDRTIVRMDNCPTFDSDSGAYGLQLDCDTAYVNGLTFVAGRNGPYFDGTEYTSRGLLKVRAAGAVVTNCVFRDLKSRNRVWGNGLDITAGTVVDCLFTRIDSFSSGGSPQQGGVIMLQGGLVDRTRVEGCLSRSDSGTVPGTEMGDIIAVWGSGVLRNSLVTHCVCAMSAPVYVGKNTSGFYGGCIVNCTIVANTNTQSKVTYIKNAGTENEQLLYYNHTGGLQMNGGAVTNCIVVDNWSAYGNAVSNIYCSSDAAGIGYTLVDDRQGDASFVTAENHNVAVAPNAKVFRKPADGDYVPATGSPALNAGLLLDWMSDAVDLAGRPRVISRIPDVGCYEGRAPSFEIRLR